MRPGRIGILAPLPPFHPSDLRGIPCAPLGCPVDSAASIGVALLQVAARRLHEPFHDTDVPLEAEGQATVSPPFSPHT